MKNVESDPEKYTGYPAPQASPLIDQAVEEIDGTFVPAFEIVDDDPKPEEVLQQKKNLLLGFIMTQERLAEEAVVPLGRRRYLAICEADIAAEEQRQRVELHQRLSMEQTRKVQTAVRTHADDVGSTTSAKKIQQFREQHEATMRDLLTHDISAEVEANVGESRSDEDRRFLEEQAVRHRRLNDIRRHGAKLQNDVEDLTTETIDAWFDDFGHPKLLEPFPAA